jgi:hypothetical protein
MRIAAILISLTTSIAYSQSGAPPAALSASEIMQRVAENQDRLVNERTRFVYDEMIRVISRHRNGKLICEQTTKYTVSPKEKTSERTLVSMEGQYWHDGHLVAFQKELPDDRETLDSGLVKSFRDDLTQTDNKDGLGHDLFPLTTSEQKDLEFKLDGERVIAGRPAYIVAFRPKNHSEIGWAGEALVDKQEFQPVTVYTKLSKKLPFFVRTMLGTDVPGLGFTTQYTRVADGVWFPSSFGTEFKVHAVYFFHRTISVSLQNSNFRHTSVDSQIRYETPSASSQ